MPKLTKRLVEAIEPEAEIVTLWDSEIKGFGVRVRPSGKRVYILKYRNRQGRQRKPSLGVHGAITTEQARKLARSMLGEIANGSDPSGDIQSARHTETIKNLCQR